MEKQPRHNFLPFDELPLDPAGPRGNAWGRFGASDQLGMLNLLTPETVAAAAKEIRDGVRISLDWPLNMPSYPSFGRDPFKHEVVNKAPRSVNDDVLTFNTQCSSQWDGFRHYGYQKEKRYFNNHTQEEIESSTVIGLDVVAEAGGIVGRGVLLDYAEWASRHSIPIQPLKSVPIPLHHLKQVVEEQRIEFLPGDILFIRSGFTVAYNTLSLQQQKDLAQRSSPDFAGVEATEEMLRWLWEHQFAAVAGDAPSFERAPIAGAHANLDTMLHQWLLAGWGMPIGEMFDLERLAVHCRRTARYSFFLSSVPLKVPGGVASPPNAIAIF